MATNKHAVIRYQTLDKCFRNPGRRYFIDDLIEACNESIYEFTGKDEGIKKRQIFDDIRFMESPQGWNIPLEHLRDGHKIYYRYANFAFSINNQPLNENEEKQLKEAMLTLSRFKGMPQFEWVSEITARLDSGLKLSHNEYQIIQFEQNDFLEGIHHITPLYNAILYKNTLDIEYRSFKQDTPYIIVLHPYFLKQYNNRWYIFGMNNKNKLIINLALDRIVSINESKEPYLTNNAIDFEEYFDDVIGVTVQNNEPVQRIELKVSNQLFPYIQTKPLHGSQKITNRHTDFITIALHLIPNYELESLLLSMGEGIEVLSPETLRRKIYQRANDLVNNYKK